MVKEAIGQNLLSGSLFLFVSKNRKRAKVLYFELARGVAPSGQRIVSERNLLERRQPYARVGEFRQYGMGLGIEGRYGITSIDHGGSLFGYRGQVHWLPDHGVGVVILTNADTGGPLMRVVYRYLLELLFDGKPEAVDDLHTAARTIRDSLAKERVRLTVPADARAVAALAARYPHPTLGAITMKRRGAVTRFDFGEWGSDMASRANEDGGVLRDALARRRDLRLRDRGGAARPPARTVSTRP